MKKNVHVTQHWSRVPSKCSADVGFFALWLIFAVEFFDCLVSWGRQPRVAARRAGPDIRGPLLQESYTRTRVIITALNGRWRWTRIANTMINTLYTNLYCVTMQGKWKRLAKRSVIVTSYCCVVDSTAHHAKNVTPARSSVQLYSEHFQAVTLTDSYIFSQIYFPFNRV